jgi:hypothetical protein
MNGGTQDCVLLPGRVAISGWEVGYRLGLRGLVLANWAAKVGCWRERGGVGRKEIIGPKGLGGKTLSYFQNLL